MRFLIEYYPHDFRIHEAPISEDNVHDSELFARVNTYKMEKERYNSKHDCMVEDGDLFSYNNSWWLMIEAKSLRQAINIFWKKAKNYKAKELLKSGAVAG